MFGHSRSFSALTLKPSLFFYLSALPFLCFRVKYICTYFLVRAVDMKMEYEYVCRRSKDIAYGEPLCIMQHFLSHLHSFRHTHTHNTDSHRYVHRKKRAINCSPSRSSHKHIWDCTYVHNSEQVIYVVNHVVLQITAHKRHSDQIKAEALKSVSMQPPQRLNHRQMADHKRQQIKSCLIEGAAHLLFDGSKSK